jgi:hypothetical protein
MAFSFRQTVVIGLLVGIAACSKKTPEPTAIVTKVPSSAATAKAQAEVSPDGKLDPNDPRHGTRKLMGLDAPVYVDGVQVAVMRAGEMPPIKAIELEGGARRYRMYDYLKGIGISPDAIKAVHFHGNADRISSLEGSELRKEKDRFVFSYLSGDTGAPIQTWTVDHLKNPFVIHEIRRVTVYVKKPVPTIAPAHQCHVGADGDCSEAIPYATGEIAKGTRVYLDGRMMGFVKRRQLGDALILSGTGEDTRYSVAKLAAQMGVEPSAIQTVEFVAGDDVVARATGEKFTVLASQTYFTLPKHNHGKVRVHVPAEFQAPSADGQSGVTDRDGLISSVLLYKDTVPPKRDLVTISEDTDLSVQVAAIDDARARLGRGEQ